MTRTPDDARYRPMPGDTRRTQDEALTVTRATDWAVEVSGQTPNSPGFPAKDAVMSVRAWAALVYDGTVWTPKVRTAHDARFDPLPGDTWRYGDVTCTVTARDGDYVDVAAVGQHTGASLTHADRWSVTFWSSGPDADTWTAG